jgi:hypothetical protein
MEQQMTDMHKIKVCKACGTDVKLWKECPRCAGTEFEVIYEARGGVATREKMRDYVNTAIAGATAYIPSRYACFFCDKGHLMIWPAVRNETNYNKLDRLTLLPQCPVKVWNLAKNVTDKPLEKFLLEVKNE